MTTSVINNPIAQPVWTTSKWLSRNEAARYILGCTEDYLLGKTNERVNNSLTVIVGSEVGDKDA